MIDSMENFMNLCPRCGKPLPCILHDPRHLKELLHPVEPAPTFEKTAEWEYGRIIYSITSLTETTALVGGTGGKLELWEIPKEKLRAYYERKAATPEIPPVPEE